MKLHTSNLTAAVVKSSVMSASVCVMRFHTVSGDHRGRGINVGLCPISVNQRAPARARATSGHRGALFDLDVSKPQPQSEVNLLSSLRPAVGVHTLNSEHFSAS